MFLFAIKDVKLSPNYKTRVSQNVLILHQFVSEFQEISEMIQNSQHSRLLLIFHRTYPINNEEVTMFEVLPLKCSGKRWLHFEVSGAIQV